MFCWKPPDHKEVFFIYSYTKFVFNFQFEKSLIKYVKKIIIIIIIVIIIIIIIIIIIVIIIIIIIIIINSCRPTEGLETRKGGLPSVACNCLLIHFQGRKIWVCQDSSVSPPFPSYIIKQALRCSSLYHVAPE